MSEDPQACDLRNRLVFYIVPMLNPDGVVIGNYRTGFAGVDLNRQFQLPNAILHPTVSVLKALLNTRILPVHKSITAYLDLHAHSQQKSVFMYGPHYPLHAEKYSGVRVLPRLICAKMPYFRWASCKFRNERSKQKAARLVVWKQLKLMNTFTIEASFYGYLTKDRDTVAFTESTLVAAGEGIGRGIWDYVHIGDPEVAARCLPKRKLPRFRANSQHTPSLSPVKPIAPAESPTAVSIDPVNDSAIETNSDSSDGDSVTDDLLPADQHRLHAHIVAVTKAYNALPSPIRPNKARVRIPADPKSSLQPFFSGALARKSRAKSRGKALIPKLYDPSVCFQRREHRSISLKDQPVRASMRDISPRKGREGSARPKLQRQRSANIDSRG